MRRSWLLQVGVSLSQLLNAVLAGWADESLSSRSWRMQGRSKGWARVRGFVDLLLGHGHCQHAHESEIARAQMPPELRDRTGDRP